MKPIERLALMSGSSHRRILNTATEELKEPMCLLVGQYYHDIVRVFSTYSYQSAERRDTEVWYGNQAAVERIRKQEKVWQEYESYVGGFHSHILGRENNSINPSEANNLSDNDIDFILGEMRALKKKKWLEIVLKIQELKRLPRAHSIGETTRTRHRKINSAVYDEPKHGYLSTFSAYLIYLADGKPKIKPLTLRDEIIEIVRRGYKE